MCDYTHITAVQVWAGLKDIGRNPFVYALVAAWCSCPYRRSTPSAGSLSVGRACALAGERHRRPASTARARAGERARPTAFVSLVVASAALPNLRVVLVSVSRDWYGRLLPTSFTLAHYESRARARPASSPPSATACGTSRCRRARPRLGVAIAYVVVAGATFVRPPARRRRDAALGGPWTGPRLRLPGDLARRDARSPSSTRRATRPRCSSWPTRSDGSRSWFARPSAGFQQISVVTRGGCQEPRRERAARLRSGDASLFSAPTSWRAEFSPSLSRCSRCPTRSSSRRNRATFPITKAIYELFQLLGERAWVGGRARRVGDGFLLGTSARVCAIGAGKPVRRHLPRLRVPLKCL